MIKNKLFLTAVLMPALCAQVEASTLTADGAWNAFDVDSSISNSGNLEWIDLDNNSLSFDFTLSGIAFLEVVDGGFAGDRFDVFDNGVLLGQETPAEIHIINTTNAVNTYPNSVGLDFDQAFADNNYSRGIFRLGVGSHSITGLLSQSALDNTGAAINATVGAVRIVTLTSIPLPAAAWLYLTGTMLMGFISRRRKTNLLEQAS